MGLSRKTTQTHLKKECAQAIADLATLTVWHVWNEWFCRLNRHKVKKTSDPSRTIPEKIIIENLKLICTKKESLFRFGIKFVNQKQTLLNNKYAELDLRQGVSHP